jgi:hypothetical protein
MSLTQGLNVAMVRVGVTKRLHGAKVSMGLTNGMVARRQDWV